MREIVLTAGVIGLLLATSVGARTAPNTGTPASIQQLLACRSITDAMQRLACYDRQTGVINQAIASRDLVVIDKARATAAKRSLFGFSIPNFGGLFGSGGELSQIDGTIKTAAHNPYGGWLITLDDGSVWSQTDDWPGLDARAGKKVVVKRGSLGSFWLSIPGENGIKVRRVG